MQGQSLLRIAKSKSGGGSGSGSDQPVYSRADLPQRGFGWSPLESWRAGKYLYIRAPKPELYDLTADPGATHNLAQSSKATLDTMAAQLESFDRHFSGEAGKSSAELSSSEMQKLASLGYIGLQKSSGSAAAVTGTDPKDKIATANKVIEAASAGDQSKPGFAIAIAALTPVVSADPNLYLAQYALGAALARKGQYTEAAKHLHKAIELQPDSAWAHYEIGASSAKDRRLQDRHRTPGNRHRTPARLRPGTPLPRRSLRTHGTGRRREAGTRTRAKEPLKFARLKGAISCAGVICWMAVANGRPRFNREIPNVRGMAALLRYDPCGR